MVGETISKHKVIEKIGQGDIGTHCAEDTRLKWKGVLG
jgi:hypothetical protein